MNTNYQNLSCRQYNLTIIESNTKLYNILFVFETQK